MATGIIHVRNQFAPESVAFLKTQPDGYTSVTDNDAAIIASIEGVETLPSTPQNSSLVEQVADIFDARWGREPRPADGPHPAGDGGDSSSGAGCSAHAGAAGGGAAGRVAAPDGDCGAPGAVVARGAALPG